MNSIFFKKDRDKLWITGHPWIYSRAIDKIVDNPIPGSMERKRKNTINLTEGKRNIISALILVNMAKLKLKFLKIEKELLNHKL